MKKPLMILGTSSGAGKSLMVTGICRLLRNHGETPVPFKGQNMSNNAWVDKNGFEMAYSQAVQAWAARLEPRCLMNPVLLKPQGSSTSEVIHLGKSVGITNAKDYYKNWFSPGWEAITKGLNELKASYPQGRLILEGAGSPVEINLKHRDLTNLRLAKYLNANCVLIADIERGGVFAQIIGTLALLEPAEQKLIKGIIINRFRGDRSLFDSGRKWIEEKTNIPVLGIMPWLEEIFPPEDSLDLLERNHTKNSNEVEIAIIKLPYISNFSDLNPLETEPSINLRWVKPGDHLGEPDAVIIPGSKQTLKDLKKLISSGLSNQVKEYAKKGGTVFGICGGLQMLGESLQDPCSLEDMNQGKTSTTSFKGLNLLPIKTVFHPEKATKRRTVMISWPNECIVSGFELHHGLTEVDVSSNRRVQPLFNNELLGWILQRKDSGTIAGTYLHGVFDNAQWRRMWVNELRKKKGLPLLPLTQNNHEFEIDSVINRLALSLQKNISLLQVLET